MLEGAQSMLDGQTPNKFNTKFHLMMISKLYMAINLDFEKVDNKNEIKKEIALFNSNTTSNSSWLAFKDIIENKQKIFIPNIASLLIKDLENNENRN